jgi:hypothetical protein
MSQMRFVLNLYNMSACLAKQYISSICLQAPAQATTNTLMATVSRPRSDLDSEVVASSQLMAPPCPPTSPSPPPHPGLLLKFLHLRSSHCIDSTTTDASPRLDHDNLYSFRADLTFPRLVSNVVQHGHLIVRPHVWMHVPHSLDGVVLPGHGLPLATEDIDQEVLIGETVVLQLVGGIEEVQYLGP